MARMAAAEHAVAKRRARTCTMRLQHSLLRRETWKRSPPRQALSSFRQSAAQVKQEGVTVDRRQVGFPSSSASPRCRCSSPNRGAKTAFRYPTVTLVVPVAQLLELECEIRYGLITQFA